MTDTLAQWLGQGPFGLTLSSGFFGFYAHAGLIQALDERNLTPARISGSSAGALVGAAWAAGLDPQDLKRVLLRLKRKDFWDPAPGFGLLQGDKFRHLLEGLLPVSRFEQTRIPVAVSVFHIPSRTTRVLDGGPLAPAIQASCCVPLMFHPTAIDGQAHWDGGILDRPGLLGMRRVSRVLYHHLPSKSPWRQRVEPPRAPKGTTLRTLQVPDLPRVTPFHLARGPLALVQARDHARRALDGPV